MTGEYGLSASVQNPTTKSRNEGAIARSVSDFAGKESIVLNLLNHILHWLWILTQQNRMKVFANHLLASPPIHFFRALVPETDLVIKIAHDDGVVAQIEQARLFGKLLLGLFAFGNIANIALDDLEVAFLVNIADEFHLASLSESGFQRKVLVANKTRFAQFLERVV